MAVLLAVFVLPGSRLSAGDLVGADPLSSSATLEAPAPSVELAPSQQAEHLWTLRRAQAKPIDFFMPFYSIEGDAEATVFLMNPIADPISVTVTALDGHGGELPLGAYVIEPRHHLELSLRSLLQGFAREFSTGSLRLSLLGDADTLQGWTVLTTGEGQSFEIPLASPTKATAKAFYSFWDTASRALPGARGVRFELLNTSGEPRRVEVTSERGRRPATELLVLPPGARLPLHRVGRRPLDPRGWIELRHGGEPGDVLAVGLVTGRHPIASLPLVGLGEAGDRRHYESMPLPRAAGGRGWHGRAGGTEVLLFRPDAPGDPPQPVTLEALDAERGTVLGTATIPLAPGEIRSLSLQRTLPAAAATRVPLRLRLRSESAPLLAQAFTAMPDGALAELMLFPRESAHTNGTYPLPDLTRYETVTTVVNVGEEDAKIVAQVTWRGGTYALGPLEVPAGTSRRIDLEEMADTLPADLLGRELDRVRPEGVLKWSVIEGGGELVARTEVRPRGREDRFGFNCWGCCWQIPEGVVVSGEVAFPLGQERGFEASVVMSDCGGTMGPYSTNANTLTYSSPFSWDGSTVTASAAADGYLSFEDDVLQITPTCTSFLKRIFGWGRAKLCKETFNPNGYSESSTCSSQTSFCLECNACCHNIAQEQTCKGKRADIVASNLNACLGICGQDFMNQPGCF